MLAYEPPPDTAIWSRCRCATSPATLPDHQFNGGYIVLTPMGARALDEVGRRSRVTATALAPTMMNFDPAAHPKIDEYDLEHLERYGLRSRCDPG